MAAFLQALPQHAPPPAPKEAPRVEARVAAVAAQTWDRRVDDVLATVAQALARR